MRFGIVGLAGFVEFLERFFQRLDPRDQRAPGIHRILVDDALQVIQQSFLFSFDLRLLAHMLQCAAAAHTEMRAARRHALCGRFDHPQCFAFVVTPLPRNVLELDFLPGKRAVDEYRFAVDVCNATTVVRQ